MATAEELDQVVGMLIEQVSYIGGLAAQAAVDARKVDLIEAPHQQGALYERALALTEANGGVMDVLERLKMLRDQPHVEYAVRAAAGLDEPVRLMLDVDTDFHAETTARRVKVVVAPGRVINIDVAVQHHGSVVAVDAEVVDDDHAAAVRSAFNDARYLDVERDAGKSMQQGDALTGAISGVGAQLAQQLNRINTPQPRPPLTPEQQAQIAATTAFPMPLPQAAVPPAWETQPAPDADPMADRGTAPFGPQEDQYVSGVQVVGGERVFGLYQGSSGNDGARLTFTADDTERTVLVWADTLEEYRPLPGDNPMVMGRAWDSSEPHFERTVIGTLTHYERQREPDAELANIRLHDGADHLVPLHTLRPAATGQDGGPA